MQKAAEQAGASYCLATRQAVHDYEHGRIPYPHTLRLLASVDLLGGSVRTQSRRNAPRGAARSVTVLAPDALTANAWAATFLALGCDRALANREGLSVVCADAAGVRWTTELQNRVSLPAARGP